MTAREPSPGSVPVSDNGHNRYYVKHVCCRLPFFRTTTHPPQHSRTCRVSIHPLVTNPRWKGAPAMPFSPLRLILSRRLHVFTHYRGFPRLFTVVEELTCGHSHTSVVWDFLDLVNAYTDNTDVSARRRRCHLCARLSSHIVESGVMHGRETEVYRNAPADHRRATYSHTTAPVG